MWFSVYLDARNEWRWRGHANNRRIIADSGEGYVNRADCLAGIRIIKNEAPGAFVFDISSGEAVQVDV